MLINLMAWDKTLNAEWKKQDLFLNIVSSVQDSEDASMELAVEVHLPKHFSLIFGDSLGDLRNH